MLVLPDVRCARWLIALALAAVLLCAAVPRASQGGRANTWSATSTSGLTLMGTWTAVPDAMTGAVAGQWTLLDPQGMTVARGGWSATKAATAWSGAWRASNAATKAEFAGTWTSGTTLATGAPFAGLFEAAANAIVSGSWQAGRYTGAWSIRAYR